AWAEKKVRDRVVAELEIESRVEKLSGQLQAADLRLEASTDTVLDVRRVIEIGQDLGANVDPTSTDEALELLASLRGKVKEAEQSLDELRKYVTPARAESLEARLVGIVKVLARILLTLSDVARRLDEFAARLSDLRGDARQLKARTSRA